MRKLRPFYASITDATELFPDDSRVMAYLVCGTLTLGLQLQATIVLPRVIERRASTTMRDSIAKGTKDCDLSRMSRGLLKNKDIWKHNIIILCTCKCTQQ